MIFKLLKAIGVEYKALNFDALEYAPNNLGNEIRASVQERTGAVTFPQVFVGGEFFALPEEQQEKLLTSSNLVFCRAEPQDKQRLLKQQLCRVGQGGGGALFGELLS